MDFFRAMLIPSHVKGFEDDIENQRGTEDVPKIPSLDSKKTTRLSSNKKEGLTMKIIGVSEKDPFEVDDPQTASDTSDSSSDGDHGGTKMLGVTEDRVVPSKSRKGSSRYLQGRGSSQLPTKSTQTSDEIQDPHFVWFPHGKFWTLFAIFCAWTGLLFSIQARDSTSFVTVEPPIYIDTTFNEIHEVGMLRLMLCFNETTTGMSSCSMKELNGNDVNDRTFNIARSMAFLSVLLGGFMAVCLTLAAFWYHINMRPVGAGLFLTYFFESFTLLFFDTKMCGKHTCHSSEGAIFAILASLCWILACIASSKMDAFKYLQKSELKMANCLGTNPQKRVLDRGISNVTKATETSYRSRSPRRKHVENPDLSDHCPQAIIIDLRDFEDSVERRPRSARTPKCRESSRTRDSRKHRGRSISSNQGSHRSGPENPCSKSKAVENSQAERSRSAIQPTPYNVKISTRADKRYHGESAAGRTSDFRSSEKESPGRKAMRTHSRRSSIKELDTRQFEL